MPLRTADISVRLAGVPARMPDLFSITPTMLSALPISLPAASRMLMRTLSQRSPSIRSLPPRPSIRSLPLPPRMMLPPSNTSSAVPVMPSVPAAAVPTNARRPATRSKLVSALPVAPPWLTMVVGSTSSPRRISAKSEPDRPSTSAKRSKIEAGDCATGRAMCCPTSPIPRKAARDRSEVTPNRSFL
ncbi:hypothetical protein D9M69_371720 [compost metagenome]